jgi:pimeloyl-ACP methyl ester carboxylesterase
MSEWREERREVSGMGLSWMTSWASGVRELPDDSTSPIGLEQHREADTSRSPIFFLHGVLRRWQDFTPLSAGLSHRWPVCGLDFPGHGRSDPVPCRYLVTDYINAATAFIQLHCPQPIVLYGHSLGAMVAAGVAANLGGRIRAIILEDPPFETMGSRIDQTPLLSYFAAVRSLVRSESFQSAGLNQKARQLANIVTTDPATGKSTCLGDVRDAAALRFFASCLAVVDPDVLAPIVAGRWLEGYDWREVVGRITAPILLLQADAAAGGMLIDDEAREFTAAAGDATLVKLAGAGHNLHTSRTQDVLNLVTQFLDALP